MHEHLLVCRSRGPPAASGSSSSAFTSMKDKRLRVLCLVSSWAEYPPPPAPRTRPRHPGCCVPRPNCAADQPVVLTHFLASFVRLKSAGNSFVSHESHFLLPGCCVIITGLPAPSCSATHLNIPLWQHNTSNVPEDPIPAGQRRCSHVPLHERNCCRLPSLT